MIPSNAVATVVPLSVTATIVSCCPWIESANSQRQRNVFRASRDSRRPNVVETTTWAGFDGSKTMSPAWGKRPLAEAGAAASATLASMSAARARRTSSLAGVGPCLEERDLMPGEERLTRPHFDAHVFQEHGVAGRMGRLAPLGGIAPRRPD